MKAIKIAANGEVTEHEGPEDFWMDDEIVWAETEPPAFPGNTIYYDDESFANPGEVRAVVGGVEIPLPAWLMGISGEDTCDPTVGVEEVRRAITLPG